MKVDLHIHTCFSDGGNSLQSIFNKLDEEGVEVVSITDHNNIDAYKHIEFINRHGVKIINGIEVDVKFNSNIYHILMYGYNEGSILFKDYLSKSREYEISQFREMIIELQQKFNIGFNKKNIERFICNNQYFDKVRLNNLLCEQGYVKTPIEAFYNFTKHIENKKRLHISAEDFFKVAKDCNAITVLAHPIKYLKDLNDFGNLKTVISELKTMGLAGIEVYNNRQTLQDEKSLLKLAQEQNLFISGGSDYHAKIGCKETKHLGKCLDRDLTHDKLTIDTSKLAW